MRARWLALAALGMLGTAGAAAGALAASGSPGGPLTHRVVLPAVARAEPTPVPTPTPRPEPYVGPIASVYLASARIFGAAPVEAGGTHYDYRQGRDVLDDPTRPERIMYYPNLPGLAPAPGFGGGHTIMAAHVNYVNYGNGPFAYLLDAQPGDALYVTMANGTEYAYTVKSVDLVHIENLDMNQVVYPALNDHTERVTLISCGGTFIPAASGYGGEYNSRIVLVAERYVP